MNNISCIIILAEYNNTLQQQTNKYGNITQNNINQ